MLGVTVTVQRHGAVASDRAGWFSDATKHFDCWRIDCDDFRDLGDRVPALGTVRAVGKESGVEVEMPYTVVGMVKNGLVTHFTDYGDREKALEAAGLSE
jgi:ketosteroid isomerase-like protein